MHGNLREWCADWYGEYQNGHAKDPEGGSSGERRVLRGVLGTTALGTVALPYATGTIRLAAASAVAVVFY